VVNPDPLRPAETDIERMDGPVPDRPSPVLTPYIVAVLVGLGFAAVLLAWWLK
jgi:hypothetical protein